MCSLDISDHVLPRELSPGRDLGCSVPVLLLRRKIGHKSENPILLDEILLPFLWKGEMWDKGGKFVVTYQIFPNNWSRIEQKPVYIF